MSTPRWPSSLGMLIGPSPHHCSPIRRAPLHSTKNEYPVLALGKETAVQAVVSSSVGVLQAQKAKVGWGDERPRLRAL